MVILGGWVFFMSEVPLYDASPCRGTSLAHIVSGLVAGGCGVV